MRGPRARASPSPRPRARGASAMTRATRTAPRRAHIEHTDAYGVMFYANHFRVAQDAVEECADELARESCGFGVDWARARAVEIEGCRYARAVTLGDAWTTTSETTRASADGTRATTRQTMRAVGMEGGGESEGVYFVADVTYASGCGTTSVVAPDWTPRARFARTAIRAFRSERSRGEDGCSHVDVLRFFERGRTDAIGGAEALAKLRERGVVVVVSSLEASFPERIAPRSADDGSVPTCEVRSVVEIKRRGIQIVFHQAFYDADGVTCLGRGSVACTCLDAKTMRPTSCPPELVDAFAPFTLVPPETAVV